MSASFIGGSMSNSATHKPHQTPIDEPDDRVPGPMPIEPDGMVPPAIPDDPEHDRIVDPEA